MKDSLKTWLWPALVCFLLMACKNDNKVTITINSKTQKNAALKISSSAHLDNTILHTSKTDSAGHSSFELNLTKPMFVYLQCGDRYGELYLTPGDDLLIEDSGGDYKTPLKFSGKGAEINNYVAWVNANTDKIKHAGPVILPQMSVEQFLKRLDSLKITINNFHKRYTDSVHLSKEDETMLARKNEIKFLQVSQEYKFYRANTALFEKRDARDNGQTYLEGKISRELENLTNEVPFDATLLTDGYGDYQMLLNFYWQNEIMLPVSERIIFEHIPGNPSPVMTDSLIEKANYPEGVREFLKSYNLNYWILTLGITPETDSVFNDFKSKYPTSSYLTVLNKQYNEWLAVTPGKPAPKLTGYTQDGKALSIEDLRGRVIYIDVWATWCAPCIAEIPASKKLQQEFADEKDLQFLNISVDYNKTSWEKFLQADTAWKGLHLGLEPDSIPPFYARYKLSYVPAYILIDRSGNIVTMKAPRPTNEQAKIQIRELLSKGG